VTVDRVAFIHIGKTGGSTFRHVVRENYPENNLFEWNGYEGDYPDIPSQARIFMGHVYFGVHGKMGEDTRYCVVLRHPVSRVVSQYRYILRVGHTRNDGGGHWLHNTLKKEEVSLKGFASRPLDPLTSNGQCRILVGKKSEKVAYGENPEWLLEEALRNVRNRFLSVGLQERMDDYLRELVALGVLQKTLDGCRINYDANRPADNSVDEESRQAILKVNRLDVLLWQDMMRKWEVRVRERFKPGTTMESVGRYLDYHFGQVGFRVSTEVDKRCFVVTGRFGAELVKFAVKREYEVTMASKWLADRLGIVIYE